MISLPIDTYNLTSMLAGELKFTNQPDEIRVIILAGQTSFFDTTVYPVDGTYTLYGFRDLLEDYLEANSLIGCQFTVQAWDVDGGDPDSITFKAIYAKVYPDNDSSDTFCSCNFLTTRTHYVIPRSGSVNLYFTCSETDNSDAPSFVCTFLKNGSITTQTYKPSYSYKSGIWYRNIIISASTLESDIKARTGSNPGTLLSATVTSGSRSMTVYIMDKEPDVSFTFMNVFNVWEQIYIWGTTTIKTTLDFKDAECNGVTKRYNQSAERVYEVETVPLSLEEADFMNQFLESKNIGYEMTGAGFNEQVILDDIDSEISDSVKETVKIKFSWRFADHNHNIGYRVAKSNV